MSPRDNTQLPTRDSFSSVESVLPQHEAKTLDEEGTTASNKNNSKSVGFSVIRTRVYNRIIGDNPSVRIGVPVTFSWEYSEIPAVSIDEYESNRAPYKRVLRMSSITRKNLLHHVFEIPEEEIANGEKEIQKIKRQNEKSLSVRGSASSVVESTRKAGRKLRKNIFKSLTATSRMMSPGLMMHA